MMEYLNLKMMPLKRTRREVERELENTYIVMVHTEYDIHMPKILAVMEDMGYTKEEIELANYQTFQKAMKKLVTKANKRRKQNDR